MVGLHRSLLYMTSTLPHFGSECLLCLTPSVPHPQFAPMHESYPHRAMPLRTLTGFKTQSGRKEFNDHSHIAICQCHIANSFICLSAIVDSCRAASSWSESLLGILRVQMTGDRH